VSLPPHPAVAYLYLVRRKIMIHIVKSTEAKQRNSFGVSFDLLAIGPQSMVTKMRYRKDNVIPFHSHPNEQSGYILSGRIRVLTDDSKHELGPGDTYAIPANVEHSIEIIEPAEEVQVFTPPREDFR
jgi:quercetin dioxygenase-like cupin family protein